jgi:DNA (cytosine-5)-methyltransferase 1
MPRKVKSIPAIGLFSGAGGLEIGAEWAGVDVRLCVELDAVACQTLRQNEQHASGAVLEEDIANLTGMKLRGLAGLTRAEPCLILGGPPCQPFSKAAYWTDPGDDARYRRARAKGQAAPRPVPITEPRHDERRSLLAEFLRLVVEVQAEGFLFENVPSIAHPRNRRALEGLIEAFETEGYQVISVKANAVEYGVPQRRHRIFLLGLRGTKPSAPSPTHSASPFGDLFLLPAVTAGEALAPFGGSDFFEPEEVVKGRWAEQLRAIPPGWNYKALTAWAGHPSPVFEAETRYWHFLLKLSPDQPSWTIPANPGPWVGPFHWKSRRLRTPELAALQGFPAGYAFAGTRRDRVRQIGNAVPPLLAQRMMESLLRGLGARQRPVAKTRRSEAR